MSKVDYFRRQLLLYLAGLFGMTSSGWYFFRRENSVGTKIGEQEKRLAAKINPKESHWVGDGFFVSTIFALNENIYPLISPFILLDHAAPKYFAPTAKKLGVGEHPHRGFETVTFAVKGEVEHRDSGGGGGRITTGGVQWMTAASGVVHEEFHSREFAKSGGEFEMIQLWVNLPAKDKMATPRYQSMAKEDFPQVQVSQHTQAKVVAGSLKGKNGPAKTFTPMNIYQVEVADSDQLNFDFASGTNCLVFVIDGECEIQGQKLQPRDLAVFERDGKQIQIQTAGAARLLVLNGEPIDEPFAHYGPFVMNTKDEILQAIEDFEAGKMGTLVKEG